MKNNIKSIITIFIILTVIIPFNIYSQSCLPYGITFTTQSQIDSFPINYPNCTEIEGLVTISGNNITNLQGLFNITEFLTMLKIENNDSLINLNGLDNVTSVPGLTIDNNDNLQNLTGLENLKTVQEITIYYNDALQNLEGLNSVEELVMLDVQLNPSLKHFHGLDSLTHIESLFLIHDNDSLVDFTGLETLNTIDGHLWISNNDSIIDLTGLDGLQGTINDLEIISNENLQNLNGLESLNVINNFLHIISNKNLVNITALENVIFNPSTMFTVSLNENLSECAIQSICNLIDEYYNTSHFTNNAPNCNSTAEVDSICNLTGIEDFETEQFITVSPNPASTTLNISSGDIHIQSISIYNQTGQFVLSKRIEFAETLQSIDISKLSIGCYFIHVVGKDNHRLRRDKVVWAEKFIVIR